MKRIFLMILCTLWFPIYARGAEPCVQRDNVLWEGLHTYVGPSGKMARIEDVIQQHALGMDNALTVAVWFGYDDVIKNLIKKQDIIEKYGAQSLYLAASMGRTKEMAILLNAGVHPDSVVQDGITPIYGAAENGCLKAMQLLVDEGGDVNRRADTRWTLLEDAVIAKQFGAAKFLLRHGYVVGGDEKSRVDEILGRMGMKREFVEVVGAW